MNMAYMQWCRCLVMLALLVTASLSWAAPKKVALLIGVGDYTAISKLEGPVHDVRALQEVLVQRWGYNAGDIHTLVDQAATRSAIKNELSALIRRTQPGDEVFLYFSGHGTSSLQPGAGGAVPDGSGAFYAVDATVAGDNLLVGRTDIRPVLEELDRNGRKVWFVVDTCFAGNMARNVATEAQVALQHRTVPLADDRGLLAVLRGVRDNFQAQQHNQSDWPYRNLVMLAASASGEPAIDITSRALQALPTVDGKPHGALTDALLRVLNGSLPADINRDGVLSLNEVYETVSLFMGSRPYGQYPQRLPAFQDDPNGLIEAPLLRGASVRAPQGRVLPEPFKVFAMPCAGQPLTRFTDPLRRIPGLVWVDRLDSTTRAMLTISRDQQHLMLLSPDGGTIATAPAHQPAALLGSLQQWVWLSNMDALAQSGRRAALQAELAPADLGVTRVVGDELKLSLRPDKAAYLMLLNVNGLGEVSVVYPYRRHELRALPASTITTLAGFTVEPPEGSDVQLWFGFDQMPPALERQLGRLNMKPGDARLIELEQMILEQQGKYSFARTAFRTYLPETLKRPLHVTQCRP
jgi:hypothetical protein